MNKPLVTVAIPTFNRPHLLIRTLNSIAEQDYENLEVIVSDNATANNEVEKVIDQFKEKFTRFRFFKQPSNIGALNNFFFLLNQAEGDYFMWLADDDEITLGYISYLADMLSKNAQVSSVSANWFLKTSETNGQLMPKIEYTSDFWPLRVIKYIWCGKDDFFYGMHRMSFLKEASFSGYCWPNEKELMNWAYVYLFDQILAGKVLVAIDEKIMFINHDYGVKSYLQNRRSLINIFSISARKLNIYALYFLKILKKKGVIYAAPFILIISFLGIGKLAYFLKKTTSKFIRI
jgi:glycosyltransferase involved in cell wall biosynthesis